MTDTREQFEAHFALTQRQAKKDNSGEYVDELVRLRWEGWQAAGVRMAYLLEFAEEVRRSGDTRLASMAIATLAKMRTPNIA